MTNKQIIIDRVDVSEWTDEEVHYKFAKHSSKAIRQIAFDLYKQLKRKEQECEELKESLKVWKYSDVQHIFKINKYEQTLTEIKEIAEKDFRHTAWEEYAKQLKQILQKISEVENAR